MSYQRVRVSARCAGRDDRHSDVVSLTFGDANASVSMLGDLTTVMAVVAGAGRQLMALADARPAEAGQ